VCSSDLAATEPIRRDNRPPDTSRSTIDEPGSRQFPATPRPRQVPDLQPRADSYASALRCLRHRHRGPVHLQPLRAPHGGPAPLSRSVREEPRHHQGGRGRAGNLLSHRSRSPRRPPRDTRIRPVRSGPEASQPEPGCASRDPPGAPEQGDQCERGVPPAGRAHELRVLTHRPIALPARSERTVVYTMTTDQIFTVTDDGRRLETDVSFNADAPLTLSASNASGSVDVMTDVTLPSGTIR